MTLKPIDTEHFYLNTKLIDLVWIGYHAQKQTNAANYHDMNRNLNWLNQLAQRLLDNDVTDTDELIARKRLEALGFGWSLGDGAGAIPDE